MIDKNHHYHVISTQLESLNTGIDVQTIIERAFEGMRPDIKFCVIREDNEHQEEPEEMS